MRKTLISFFYIFVFIAHILLLYWMLFVLKDAGIMKFNQVMLHFIGMAIFGSSLIIGTALGTKHIQKLEWKLKHQRK